jgi:hypothetical protein
MNNINNNQIDRKDQHVYELSEILKLKPTFAVLDFMPIYYDYSADETWEGLTEVFPIFEGAARFEQKLYREDIWGESDGIGLGGPPIGHRFSTPVMDADDIEKFVPELLMRSFVYSYCAVEYGDLGHFTMNATLRVHAHGPLHSLRKKPECFNAGVLKDKRPPTYYPGKLVDSKKIERLSDAEYQAFFVMKAEYFENFSNLYRPGAKTQVPQLLEVINKFEAMR